MATYKLIGADGKEYGPVSAEVLRQWIAQGRAGAQTPVRTESATDWSVLADLAEFGPDLASRPAPASIAPLPAPPPAKMNPLAMTGLILGIISITVGLCCCYGMPFSVAGIVCSSIALVQLGKDSQGQQGKGVAIAGLVISILSLLLALGLMIVVGVTASIPDVLRELERP